MTFGLSAEVAMLTKGLTHPLLFPSTQQAATKRQADRKPTETLQGETAMKELTINTTSYLLIGLLGATGLVLTLVSIWKASQFSHRLRSFMKSVVWSALAILCLCAIVLLANSVETVRAFQIISHHVQAVIRGFNNM